MDDQKDPEKPVPRVDTASFAREGENLVLTLDGEESLLPGGLATVRLIANGKAKVSVWAEFEAGAVDVLAAEDGS